MSKEVTNRQLVFIIIFTLTTTVSTFLPSIMAAKTEGGFWVSILITTLLFMLIAALITALQKRHSGKTVFEYTKDIAGPLISYIITAIYFLFFLAIFIFISHDLISLMKNNFLMKTPPWFILMSTLVVSGYGAYKGITNIARLFEIYGVITLLGLFSLTAIMLFQGELRHVRPLFVSVDTGKYLFAVKDAALAFVGLEVIMIIPLTKNNKRTVLLSVLTVLGIGLLYIVIVGASIMMVGANEIIHYRFSVLTAIRQIEIPNIEFLRRFDIVYLVASLLGSNACFMIINCALTENAKNLIPKVKRIYTVIIVTAVAFIGGVISFSVENFRTASSSFLTYFALLTSLVIPLVLLIFSRRKKHEEIA